MMIASVLLEERGAKIERSSTGGEKRLAMKRDGRRREEEGGIRWLFHYGA